MKPNCGVSGAQGEISKVAEAGEMTAAESNRAISDSMGDQGHTSESKEGAEKTRGGGSQVNIGTCSEAAEVSTGQRFLGTGSVDGDV